MKRRSSSPRAYQPLMDWWVAGLVLILIALLAAFIPFIVVYSTTLPMQIASVLVVIIIILYIADKAFFSYYLLESEGLSIISQLRHAFFPYRDMDEIKPSNVCGLISIGTQKRFALSVRCYKIRLRKGHWKSITVSPAQRDSFINTLLERIDQERSSRATVERLKK